MTRLTKARLLAAVTEFSFDSGNPLSPVTVERTGRQREDYSFDPWADVWAVRWRGWCLDVDGAWVYEPMSSSRDAEFYERHRWPRDEALERAAVAAALRQALSMEREKER